MFWLLKQKIIAFLPTPGANRSKRLLSQNAKKTGRSGQAMAEYAVILGGGLIIGLATNGMFEDLHDIDQIIYDYYISLADYMNLAFF